MTSNNSIFSRVRCYWDRTPPLRPTTGWDSSTEPETAGNRTWSLSSMETEYSTRFASTYHVPIAFDLRMLRYTDHKVEIFQLNCI